MADKVWDKKLLLLKNEVTYGTDPTPTAGANAILAQNCSITAIEGQDVERPIYRGYIGARPSVLVGKYVTITFDVDFASAGAAGTGLPYAPGLISAGMDETITDDTDASYAFANAAPAGSTIYYYEDGTLHKIIGILFNVKGKGTANNGSPVWTFEGKGLFVAPTDTAMPTGADFSAFQDPLPITDAFTPNFQINAVDLVLVDWSIDFGINVTPRLFVNQEKMGVPARSVNGSFEIVAPPLATINFFDLAVTKATKTFKLTHGNAAGKILELTAPKTEFGRPQYKNVDGFTHLTVPYKFLPDEGNDELLLVAK